MDSRTLKTLLFTAMVFGVGCMNVNTFTAKSLEPSSQNPILEDLPEPPPIQLEAPTKTVEKPSEEPQKESTTEILEKGFIKPTIYFFPIVNEDDTPCARSSDIVDKGGATLITVCKSTFALCSEQGSCAVIQNGKKRSFNIIGKILGQERYFETTEHACKFGYGVKSSCLDPFYSVAADLSIYKPGDVIFVPSIQGLTLPDGSKHTGYFLIRDKGRGVIGKGRFDFFSGYFSWKSRQNPFSKLGLGSETTQVPYMKIAGATAKAFVASRAFPRLPQGAIDEMPIK